MKTITFIILALTFSITGCCPSKKSRNLTKQSQKPEKRPTLKRRSLKSTKVKPSTKQTSDANKRIFKPTDVVIRQMLWWVQGVLSVSRDRKSQLIKMKVGLFTGSKNQGNCLLAEDAKQCGLWHKTFKDVPISTDAKFSLIFQAPKGLGEEAEFTKIALYDEQTKKFVLLEKAFGSPMRVYKGTFKLTESENWPVLGNLERTISIYFNFMGRQRLNVIRADWSTQAAWRNHRVEMVFDLPNIKYKPKMEKVKRESHRLLYARSHQNDFTIDKEGCELAHFVLDEHYFFSNNRLFSIREERRLSDDLDESEKHCKKFEVSPQWVEKIKKQHDNRSLKVLNLAKKTLHLVRLLVFQI